MTTTYFVDPVEGSNSTGDGSEGNPFASVYGGAAASSYGVSTAWKVKRGTTHGPIDAAFSGNPANESQRVTYSTYGTGAPPVIDASNSVYGIRVQNKDYVTVEDFDIYSATNTGLQVLNNGTRACSHFRANRVRAYGCGVGGVVMTHAANSPSPAINVIFDGCEGHNNGQHGVAIVAYATNPIIRNARASNNSLSSSGWGVYHGGWGQTFIGTTGWTVAGNVKSRALAVEPVDVISGNTVGGAFFLVKNTGTPTTPGTGEWGYSSGTIYVNLGAITGGYSVAVIYQRNTGAIIENSYAWNHNNANYDMVGIGLDRGVVNGRVTRCIGYDNGGSAIQCNQTQNSVVEYCLGYRCREVVFMSTQSGANTAVKHNSGVGTTYGLRFARLYSGDTITVSENAVDAEIAMYAETITGTLTADYNGYTGTLVGISAGSNDIPPPLLLAPDYSLLPGSPLIGGGTHEKYTTDVRGKAVYNPPSIGAIEYERPRVSRS